MKKRIWELDALRGFGVILMIIIHLIYDLVDLYGVINWDYPPAYSYFKNWSGTIFVVISGICVTMGTRPVRRGIRIFGWGMVITAVTAGMYFLGLTGRGIIIYYGVLHCLGTCMVLWVLLRKLPTWSLAPVGLGLTVLGIWMRTHVRVSFPWLVWAGFLFPGFASSDYYPLLPYLGFFLMGAFIGRTLYKKQQSLLPNRKTDGPLVRFLMACGEHSLKIYLIHQPVLAALVGIIALMM